MSLHIITDKDCGDVVTIHPNSEPECFAGFSYGILYIDRDCTEMLDERSMDVLSCYKNDPHVHMAVGPIGKYWL